MIAGFESPDEGEIYLGDEPINALTPNKRDTAMVFQSYALLPHYNVFDNVAYGVKLRASAPSIHMLRADIQTEISPMVGNEQQSEDLVQYLLGGYESDPEKLWDSNIFGRSVLEVVNEGLNT